MILSLFSISLKFWQSKLEKLILSQKYESASNKSHSKKNSLHISILILIQYQTKETKRFDYFKSYTVALRG